MKSIPIEALVEVLGYMHNEELNHYRDHLLDDDCEDEDHIYDHVLTLLRWIATTYAPGEAQTFALRCIDECRAKMEDTESAA
jgi:hypothetical protein